MSRLIVHSFTISLDGYGAGPNQTKETPLGEGGEELHEWLVGTRFFMQMTGREGGTTGFDNEFAEQGMANAGAFIMGRNMFGPVRGAWPDESWRGWWGKNPPYHAPTFVLTHHPRAPQEMEGGTVFHFVTDGIHAALEQARAAAGEKNIRLMGGVETIRQYLEARLVDEMHIAVSPRLLGSGEALFMGLDLTALGYSTVRFMPGEKAVYYVIERGLRRTQRVRSCTRRRLRHAATDSRRRVSSHAG
jgi:dihydrofolate reductase